MASNVVPMSAGGSESAARIENDELVLENFREHDQRVVALAKEAESIDMLVHDLLAIGGRAMGAAQTTTDVAIVEKAFGDMSTTFTRGLDHFGEELEKKTNELLDEDTGALPRSLEDFKKALENL